MNTFNEIAWEGIGSGWWPEREQPRKNKAAAGIENTD